MSREQLLSQVFVELADTLVAEFDVLDLMHTLTDRSVELLHADAAGIILVDQRGNRQVIASTSHQTRVLELFELQISEGPCVDCITTGEPVINVDLDTAASRWPNFVAEINQAGYRSTHALPLRLRSQVIGAMNLFCRSRSQLSDDDIAVGQALADVATIGLLQERAVREQGLLAEQLQTALNSRVMVEQAKGALSERASVDVDEAFQMIRDHSRRTRTQLSAIAAAVIDGSITTADLRATQNG